MQSAAHRPAGQLPGSYQHHDMDSWTWKNAAASGSGNGDGSRAGTGTGTQTMSQRSQCDVDGGQRPVRPPGRLQHQSVGI